jgi:hypothetical protein
LRKGALLLGKRQNCNQVTLCFLQTLFLVLETAAPLLEWRLQKGRMTLFQFTGTVMV